MEKSWTMISSKEIQNVLKFIFSSFSSYLGELFIFILFISWLKPLIGHFAIIVATIIARICSACYCYYFNSRLIFGTKHASMTKYNILIVVQMFLSAICVYCLAHIVLIKEMYIKMFVDTILFIVSYFVQKNYIFNIKNEVN